jgi:hypothetical protein
MKARDFLDGHEADIMAVADIARTGITEADKEKHGQFFSCVDKDHKKRAAGYPRRA